MFIASFAPSEIPEGTKREKVKAWLRAINVECNEPLEVLGNLLGDLLEKEYYDPDPRDSIHHYMKKFYSYKKINIQF
ncbi:hypothetical protein [Bartonella sp. CM120XJJH]|uniref:hypothetical protein n=1 Tax=Bartonella sp. CM120XJJH TaxID=3243544 RepID=UPI0035CFB2E0